jgi:hypothetical protein
VVANLDDGTNLMYLLFPQGPSNDFTIGDGGGGVGGGGGGGGGGGVLRCGLSRDLVIYFMYMHVLLS